MVKGKEPSWEMKKAIIDLAAKQGPKPIVIERDLDRMVGSRGLLQGESVPNFRTIGRVLKEFQMMDREIIVSEFKPYVWRLRKDSDEFNDGLLGDLVKKVPDKEDIRSMVFEALGKGPKIQPRGPGEMEQVLEGMATEIDHVAELKSFEDSWWHLS